MSIKITKMSIKITESTPENSKYKGEQHLKQTKHNFKSRAKICKYISNETQ